MLILVILGWLTKMRKIKAMATHKSQLLAGGVLLLGGNRPTGCVRPSPSYPWPPPADDEQRKVVLEHEVEWAPALRAAVVRPGSRLIDVAIRCLDGATVPVGELLSRGDVNARLGR